VTSQRRDYTVKCRSLHVWGPIVRRTVEQSLNLLGVSSYYFEILRKIKYVCMYVCISKDAADANTAQQINNTRILGCIQILTA
jgi:hypothetical protein